MDFLSAEWSIVALITHKSRILISAVQLGKLSTRKFASPDTWESFVALFRGGSNPFLKSGRICLAHCGMGEWTIS